MTTPNTTEDELDRIFSNLYLWDNSAAGAIKIEQSLADAKQSILALIDESILTELKIMWNETQPDIIPDGAYETDEANYLRARIVELTKSKDKEDK